MYAHRGIFESDSHKMFRRIKVQECGYTEYQYSCDLATGKYSHAIIWYNRMIVMSVILLLHNSSIN